MTLTVSIDGQVRAHVLFPLGRFMVGRHADSCVLLEEEWVSRVQAEIIVLEDGWVVTNGYRTRMQAQSQKVQAEAGKGGSVWVPRRGQMRLRWPELPHELLLQVNLPIDRAPALPLQPGLRVPRLAGVGTLMPRFNRAFPGAEPEERPRKRRRAAGLGSRSKEGEAPDGEREELGLEALQRRRMAVLFRHELLGTSRPRNLYAAAAVQLGVSEASLKQLVHRMLQRFNHGRAVPLSGVDALGHYLVHTSETVTVDDLPDGDAALPG